MLEDRIQAFLDRYALDVPARAELTELVRLAAATMAGSARWSLVFAGSTHAAPPVQPTLMADDLEADGPAADAGEDLAALSEGTVERYEHLGPLGAGGMGEVNRVLDRALGRVTAMKVIRGELLGHALAVARFVEEAQVTAQLQHPNIVPVYELGRLSDGRLYFTMKEIKGRTLTTVLREVHAASAAGRWGSTEEGWSLVRLIEVFRKVCDALGYAHARGVVHRDLKPDNVLVGEYGEVLVADWGLAKVIGRPDLQSLESGEAPVVTRRGERDVYHTAIGAVAGTPAYMPPEQAAGEIGRLGPPSDVYALGAILFEILTGEPPPLDLDVSRLIADRLSTQGLQETADAMTSGVPADDLRTDDGPDGAASPRLHAEHLGLGVASLPIPEELGEIALKALKPAQEDRFPDAAALAMEVAAWLEGTRRRDRARKVLAMAEALQPEVARLEVAARKLRAEAAAQLAAFPPFAPLSDKKVAWSKEDQAARMLRASQLREVRRVELLRAALTHDPELPEAHAQLAAHYAERHAAAEADGDARQAIALEVMLRTHANATGEGGGYAAYLRGTGALTLVTEPPGAEVTLRRYEEIDRRLVPVVCTPRGRRRLSLRAPQVLGRTPLYAVPLEMGSYLLELRTPGCEVVRYPVSISRQAHWDTVPPGGRDPDPVLLPPLRSLQPDDIYIPAGWCRLGGDPESPGGLPRQRVWVDAFVLKRFPVTNGEWLEFLNERALRLDDAALAPLVPRRRGADRLGASPFLRGADGRFAPDPDDPLSHPEQPVVLVPEDAVHAYVAWRGVRDGVPWRLPGELEWEKAARGVDARPFPWGSYLDPTFCAMRGSARVQRGPALVTAFPLDESPYGVRGLAGNVRDLCADLFTEDGPRTPTSRGASVPWPPEPAVARGPDEPVAGRVVRGAAWDAAGRYMRTADRHWISPSIRFDNQGFRLARSMRGLRG